MTTKIDDLSVNTADLNFTQTPTIPTQSAGNRTSSIANTAFVNGEFSNYAKSPNVSVNGIKTFTGTQTVTNLNGVSGSLSISDSGVTSTLALGVAGGNLLLNTINQGFNSTWKWLITSLPASIGNSCNCIQTGSFAWTITGTLVVFPQPFPFTPTIVISQSGTSTVATYSIQGPSTLSFNVRSSGSGATTINWVAISA